MFGSDLVAGSWQQLDRRIEQNAALLRWAEREPVLADLHSLADVASATSQGSDPGRADAVLGALIRLGSIAGGDDADAVLVVLQLMSAGICWLARELQDLTPDPVGLIVGELAGRIREYGTGVRGGRVQRCFALGLLRQTRAAVLRELRPHATPKRPRDADILVNPLNPRWVHELLDRTVPGPGPAEGLDLGDVLLWAARNEVAAHRDLQMLLAAECSRQRGVGAPGQRRIAARVGVHPSALRRSRARTLAALQAASGDYRRWAVSA